ncbi:hypothetical protein LTR09_006933 [Extremus antarcticus]|uniref:Uncharacterized protein n=1 Tax=Extremus antarcticus TaxID=702011 RepID=A0AAJ0DKK8_9PEZI|nr:hypothetical protein LTR09_006933 [Extremus antarcticus]
MHSDPREDAARGRTLEKKAPSSNRGTAQRTPTERTSPKRRSSPSISIVDERPAKKQRHLEHGVISIPYNDALQFYEEEQAQSFFIFCPLDKTNLLNAKRKRFMDRVVYGMNGNKVVENMVLDKATKVPWTVPKVTIEFGRIDWATECQEYSEWAKHSDGKPVGPKKLPRVEEMTGDEYEDAVEKGDGRVAPDHAETYGYCLDMGVGWLGYRER